MSFTHCLYLSMTPETFFIVRNCIILLDFNLCQVVFSSAIILSRYLNRHLGKWVSVICTHQLTSEIQHIHRENIWHSYHHVLQWFPWWFVLSFQCSLPSPEGPHCSCQLTRPHSISYSSTYLNGLKNRHYISCNTLDVQKWGHFTHCCSKLCKLNPCTNVWISQHPGVVVVRGWVCC